jgi:hypothetical protein
VRWAIRAAVISARAQAASDVRRDASGCGTRRDSSPRPQEFLELGPVDQQLLQLRQPCRRASGGGFRDQHVNRAEGYGRGRRKAPVPRPPRESLIEGLGPGGVAVRQLQVLVPDQVHPRPLGRRRKSLADPLRGRDRRRGGSQGCSPTWTSSGGGSLRWREVRACSSGRTCCCSCRWAAAPPPRARSCSPHLNPKLKLHLPK